MKFPRFSLPLSPEAVANDRRRDKLAGNPTLEVSEDVVGLLTAYANHTGQPLDVAANEILARFLYRGAVIA